MSKQRPENKTALEKKGVRISKADALIKSAERDELEEEELRRVSGGVYAKK
jgi:hypothetical protein